MSYLALIAGLALLFCGGEAMLRGAVGVALRFRLSEVFVGVAVVGFATSAPELFVSVDAALAGRPSIALGNVIGSNTANLLLILGAAAIIRALPCKPGAILSDGFMLTLGTVVLAGVCLMSGVGRIAGLVLILGLAAYLVQSFMKGRKNGQSDPGLAEAASAATLPIWTLIALLVGGLTALGFGAELLIYGAVTIAEAANISDRVISITMIALGTSLPELATGIVAAIRGQTDLAVGNVLGSCVFNVFGILGVTAVIAPIVVTPTEFGPDTAVTAAATVIVLGLAFLLRRVSRTAGVCMVGLYAAYTCLLFTGWL